MTNAILYLTATFIAMFSYLRTIFLMEDFYKLASWLHSS